MTPMAKMNWLVKEKTTVLMLTAWTILLLCFFAMGPVLVGWSPLDREIALKKAVLLKDQELLEKYKALGGPGSLGKTGLSAAKTEEEELAQGLSEIESISKQSSFRILSLKPRTAKTVGVHKELLFDLTGEGTLQAFSMFVYGAETSPVMFTVRSFSVSPESGQSEKLKASILLVRFL